MTRASRASRPARPPSGVARHLRFIGAFGGHSDLLLVALFVAIIALMILPLRPWALDGLIAANLSVSVVVLVVSVYVRSPLGLSTFPALLLFTTLFRLSLNIASTRQILLTGDAGDVIKTFGQMVVGGDVLVGLVVFLIIAIVQFIVIAKGSERIAEVGARFSLDAMPGKQMSIDADLRAGMIGKDEARARRHALESESQLYGAMDGAMKFVKGDAIAGIVIAFVNIVGGIAIGMLRKDMGLAQATEVYSVLAVGDAMVSQIPSLFMSVAAGVVVTRVNPSDGVGRIGHLAQDIVRQFNAHPRALLIAGGVVGLMALVPGFPALPFVAIGGVLAVAGWWVTPGQQRRRQGAAGVALSSLTREGSAQVQRFGLASPLAWTAPLSMVLGAALVRRMDARQLDDAVAPVRRTVQEQWGLPFPGVMLQYDDVGEDEVVLVLHGVPLLRFVVPADHLLQPLPDAEVRAGNPAPDGVPGPDLFGLASVWVPGDAAAGSAEVSEVEVEARGGTPLGLEATLARMLERAIVHHAHRLFGVQEARVLSHWLEGERPELEHELRQLVPLPRLAEVGRALLEEGVPLRDICGFAQALVDHAGREKDTASLVERVRRALADQISHQHSNLQGDVAAVLLDPTLEDQLLAAVRVGPRGSQVALPPSARQGLVERIDRLLGERRLPGLSNVLLVHAPELRPAVRTLLREAGMARWPVVAVDELRPHLHVRVMGEVGMEALQGTS